MATLNMMETLCSSVTKRIDQIKFSRQRYVMSRQHVKDNLSIEYTTIPLPKECKEVTLYYSKEIIDAYKKLMSTYYALEKQADSQARSPYIMSELDLYIRGWNSYKIITRQNIDYLSGMVERMTGRLRKFTESFDKLLANFHRLNTDSPVFPDSTNIKLYKYTNEFPYRRAYSYFFKNEKLNEDVLRKVIDDDMGYLDQLVELIHILYSGWDKIGKGESFDEYRFHQRVLIYTVRDFANALEMEIHLYEKFLSIGKEIISFKLYPKKR